MVPKKSSKADLENKKSLFFEIGLVLSMLLVLMAFEWKSTRNIDLKPIIGTIDPTNIELPPITKDPDKIELPAPPKLTFNLDRINVIENNLQPKNNDSIFDERDYTPLYPNLLSPTEETEDPEPQIVVQDMPKFGKGGLEEFRNAYVMKNIKYPSDAQDNGIEGVVYIEFVVERDGSVSNVKAIRKADQSLVQESIRVVKLSPKWTPGRHNGKPARVKFFIPINYVLNK